MLILPDEIMALLTPFKQLFSRRIWDLVQVLVVGALLAPGKRTVSAVLEVMGLKEERQFQNYHRVLNRAKWSSLAVSRLRLDAALHAPTTRQGAKKGRPLPSLKQRLTDPTTCWQRCQVGWYQQETRLLDLATATALWCMPRRDPLPIRWLLVRDPLGRLPPST